MLKKIVFRLLIISLTTWVLSGCGGGGGGGSTPPDLGPIKVEIEQVITEFKEAVEAYDVAGMLAPLQETGFKLTIREGDAEDEKPYQKLKQELEEDEADQLTWRKSPEEDENGHSYRLELDLNNYKFSNLTTTGGIVVCDFIVKESYNKQPVPKITDNGTITWDIMKSLGEWKIQSMIIEFKPITASSLQISNNKFSNVYKGFMFGKLTW